MNDYGFIGLIVGVLQIVSIIGGGGVVAYKIGRATQRLDAFGVEHGDAIKELRIEVHALKALMTEVALQKAAIERLEKWYDELRRGEGFVFPLQRSYQKSPGAL